VGAHAGKHGDAAAQCEAVYGAIADVLSAAAIGPAQVVRLDHFTASQSWLAERQKIRARWFGRPAPLASTGVATRLAPPALLSAAAVAVLDPTGKQVLIGGERHGMPAIATAVRGGPFVFVSGILNDGGSRGPFAAETEFTRQTTGASAVIADVLNRQGAHLLRLDCFVGEGSPRADLERSLSASGFTDGCSRGMLGLPFASPDLIEITALAAAPGVTVERIAGGVCRAAGFVFAAGAADAENLSTSLATAGASLGDVVRLDVYASDSAAVATAAAALLPSFPRPPVLVGVPGQVPDGDLALAAIAYAP
jgi:enamine deaminase RidA (YjgF/YER057c/UK114 family)